MSLSLDYQSLGIQTTGDNIANVPNNKLAKLMYYLECVFYVLDIRDKTFYTTCENYRSLNKREEEYVLYLARKFNPSFMLDNQLFIINSNPNFYNHCNNEFFLITDKRIGIRANSQVFIGGKSITVTKVMVCQRSWIEDNYLNPMSLYDSNNNDNRRCTADRFFCMCSCAFVIVVIILGYYFIKYLYENFFS